MEGLCIRMNNQDEDVVGTLSVLLRPSSDPYLQAWVGVAFYFDMGPWPLVCFLGVVSGCRRQLETRVCVERERGKHGTGVGEVGSLLSRTRP